MFDDKDKDMNNGNIENSENLEKEMQAANHFYDEFKNNEDRNEIHSEPEYTKHDNTVSEEPEKADFEQKSINDEGSSDNRIKDEGRHKSFHDENDSGVYRNRAPYEPIKDSYYRETVKKKRGGFKKIIAACLVVSLFGGTGIGAGYAAVNSFINSRQAAVYAPDSSGMSQNSKSSGGDISAPSGRSNNVLS